MGRRLRPDVDWSQAYLNDRMAGYRARRDQVELLRRERRERQRVVNLRPLDVTQVAEYRRALEITSAAGIVGDALRDLELICKAGIEGLEPVFELLESARG